MVTNLSANTQAILPGSHKSQHSQVRRYRYKEKKVVQNKKLKYQTSLPLAQIDDEKTKNLDKELKEIYNNIKNKFKNFGTFQDVLLHSSKFSSKDLKNKQIPEEFTKQTIIDPLLDCLGFEIVRETVLLSPGGLKRPDYIIWPRSNENFKFYVEAEPLDADLNSKNKGVSQINSWLISKLAVTSYAFATNGFEWILIKYDAPSAKGKEIWKVNLRDVFKNIHNPGGFFNKDEIEKLKSDFLVFHSEYVPYWLDGYLSKIEDEKEDISNNFYNNYVKDVFGYEDGEPTGGVCLQNKIIPPASLDKKDSNTFSVIFMNRLIFIKFLEDKGVVVPKNILSILMDKYKSSGTSGTFYETYLKPLFYDVFNKSVINRSENAKNNPLYNQIDYLNGGLFRETLIKEKDYNIEDDGVELVIKELLKKYKFSFNSDSNRINQQFQNSTQFQPYPSLNSNLKRINPDILGYIFEKTINYIAGIGTNQQKNMGAYYTPNDVVEFIVENTLIPIIFRKMVEGLKNAGWSDTDLKGFKSIRDILNDLPKNPKHIRAMVESIGTIRVLDLACGSGHFLTAVLAEILRVEEHLLRTINSNVKRYNLKKDIIAKNIFGVDIDDNAVEITRLRLWLSVIEEIEIKEDVDTLPNIDFNIVTGNSLIGNLNEKLMHPLTGLSEEPYIKEIVESLKPRYGKEITEIENFLEQRKLEDTIKAYEGLRKIYTSKTDEDTVKVREVLIKIREKLYEIINNSYISFLHDNANLSSTKYDSISKQLEGRKPFHWSIDFGHVLRDGGFDVIVGNPPYIEDRNYNKAELYIIKSSKDISKQGSRNKSKKQAKRNDATKIESSPLFYATKDCGNTYAYFIERSIKLLKMNGRFGFIVPLSLISTERMKSIRDSITNNSCEVNYYNFDDRPGKIFSGLEDCRSNILITEKGSGVNNVTTSKYHRWFSRDRPHLFKNLETNYWDISDPGEIIPKIGTMTEKYILNKLNKKSNLKTVKNFVKDNGVKIWYHNAPRYWIHAHTEEYLPKVEYYKGYEERSKGKIIPRNLEKTEESDQYKSLIFNSKSSIVINGLLNSSLFYWWFIIWSDGRHLLDQHIKSFPIDLDDSTNMDLRARLKPFVDKLMSSYDETSNIKINLRKGGYAIKIKEIFPSKSKNIIDEIDDVLADYYQFNESEISFIKNFDIKFRINGTKTQEQNELEQNLRSIPLINISTLKDFRPKSIIYT